MKNDDELNPFCIIECANALRILGKSIGSLEELGQAIADQLYAKLFTQRSNKKACALVRFFRTIEFQHLTEELQQKVIASHGAVKKTDKFLTLLGTAGDASEWNDRKKSAGHQVIPLLSAEMISASPMIASLVSQLGIEVSSLLKDASRELTFKNPVDRDYNIFYVADAHKSPIIPSQATFVEPYKIRSVVGYGSLLSNGHFYAVIMFYKIGLPTRLVKQFTTLALSTTIAVLSVAQDALFKIKRDRD